MNTISLPRAPQVWIEFIKKYIDLLFALFHSLSGRFTKIRKWDDASEAALQRIFHLWWSINKYVQEISEDIDTYTPKVMPAEHQMFQEILKVLPQNSIVKSLTIEQFKSGLKTKQAYLKVETLLAMLRSWENNLKLQHESILHIQRYVAVVISKYPLDFQKQEDTFLPKEELREIQKINKEILACELLLGKTHLDSLPINVQIEPTNRCNAKCKTCRHRSTKNWAYYDVDHPGIDKLRHVLSISNFVEIFGHGEPSIATSFDKLIDLCKNGVSEIRTITNGTFLTQNPAFSKLNLIGISFDGGTRKTFEAIRVGINFEKLIESIKTFRSQYPEIKVYFVVTVCKANLAEITTITQLAIELGLFAVTFHSMSATSPELRDLVVTKDDMHEYQSQFDKAAKIAEGTELKLFNYMLPDPSTNILPILSHEQAVEKFNDFVIPKDSERSSLKTILNTLREQAIPYRSPQIMAPENRPSLEMLKSTCSNPRLKVETQSLRSKEDLQDILSVLQDELKSRGPNNLKIPYCLAPWYRLVINVPGSFKPCVSFNQKYASLRVIESFEEAWNGDFLKKLRNSFHENEERTGRCKSCSNVERFQGLTELLHFMRDNRLNYEEVSKHPEFNPPAGKLLI
jgi:MoaA/NifB/PqqE/SkfB family radical SAM enzyme